MNLGFCLWLIVGGYGDELLDFHDLSGDLRGDGVVDDRHAFSKTECGENPILSLRHADATANQGDFEVGHCGERVEDGDGGRTEEEEDLGC